MDAFVDTLDSRDSDAAAFTTLYYPWIAVPGIGAVERTVPPCGHVAGVWARTDAERGVFKPPPTRTSAAHRRSKPSSRTTSTAN
ncbi:hypothetical protein OOK13_29195 [Streptomyces sp. NBC_00378]|uniref:hypothetical protein n=1 Tax=unclassified Streptomyces TaxID=2593676 RepID=UPI00224D8455|nr:MULTISPECIES: hypothetical protein [unclassified Streptomyces]MCX5112484.1 hypothetical protein [Streptomyces sp. NBC_00378]